MNQPSIIERNYLKWEVRQQIINRAVHSKLVEFVGVYSSYSWPMEIQTTDLWRCTLWCCTPLVQRLQGTMKQCVSATGCNRAMHFRYRYQHSLSGAMDFSWVLLSEILFPNGGCKWVSNPSYKMWMDVLIWVCWWICSIKMKDNFKAQMWKAIECNCCLTKTQY